MRCILLVLACATYSTAVQVIPALGRTADLGQAFVKQQEAFLPFGAFKSQPPNESYSVVHNPSAKSTFNLVRNEEDKYKSLGLTVSASANLFAGRVEANAGLSYLSENSFKSNYVNAVLTYKASTAFEYLNIKYESLIEVLSLSGLANVGVTDMVSGIQWGVYVVISFTKSVASNEDAETVRAELSATISGICTTVNANTTASFEQRNKNSMENINIQIYGDVLPDKVAFGSISEVIDFLNTVPTKIENTNEGKGSQQSFTLLSLKEWTVLTGSFQNILPYATTKIDVSSTSYDEALLQTEIYNTELIIKEDLEEFSMLYDVVLENQIIIPSMNLTSIEKRISSCAIRHSLLQARTRMLLNVNSTNASSVLQNYKEIRDEYNGSDCGQNGTSLYVKNILMPLISKIEDYHYFLNNGVIYVTKSQTVRGMLSKYLNQTVEVFSIRSSWKYEDIDQWNVGAMQFVQKKGIRVVVDCDIIKLTDNFCKDLKSGMNFGYLTTGTWDVTFLDNLDRKKNQEKE